MDSFHELQENLIDFFENIDDKTLVEFIECFLYHKPTDKTEVSKLVERFLKENELSDVYLRYLSDLQTKRTFFSTSMMERAFMEQLNAALLSISFNRFRNYV